MADVYAARFLASRRKVAVKLLDPLLAGDLEIVARFRHEFLILTRVRHRHLVPAIDMAVTARGQPYFTLELVRGPTLEQRLRAAGCLPAPAVIELGRQLCGATAALHRAGVIHRDIKPTNVLLAETPGEPPAIDARLIDLGIAWLTPDYFADTDPYMTPPGGRVATRRGQLLGTPGYTPPEAGRGPSAPTRDVFALGVLLYRALTGRMPFAAPYSGLADQVARPFAALQLAVAPPAALEEVLLAALSPDPRARLPRPEALAEELTWAAELVGEAPAATRSPSLADQSAAFAVADTQPGGACVGRLRQGRAPTAPAPNECASLSRGTRTPRRRSPSRPPAAARTASAAPQPTRS
jgi:serine/threonine-protein kinase